MAHTKAAGQTKLGRDSQPQYLGVKLYGGQKANVGNIIVRQRGLRFLPGKNVRAGKDDTLYAAVSGIVKFTNKKKMKFDGTYRQTKVVNIVTA